MSDTPKQEPEDEPVEVDPEELDDDQLKEVSGGAFGGLYGDLFTPQGNPFSPSQLPPPPEPGS